MKNWRRWILRLVSFLLMVVGVALLCTKPASQVLMKHGTEAATQQMEQTTPEEVKEAEQEPATYHYEEVSPISLESILRANRSRAKAPMVGEIVIPDIGINLPIVKGISDHNLLVGAATMKPGQQMGVGNYTLASHYSDAYGETLLFAPLKRAQIGMNVYLTDMSQIYEYQITSITMVQPSELSVLNDTESPTLTLVTCNGLDATLRRIVRADLVTTFSVSAADQAVKNLFTLPVRTY